MPPRPLRIVAAVHDPPVWTLPAREVERLAAALPDFEVVDARTAEERRRAFPTADILLATKLTSDEARVAARLKWIQSTAVGISPILVPEVVNSSIVVTNARGIHAEFIAEHAIALALAVRRSLHTSAARQAARVWAQTEIEAVPCPPPRESRLLVVGLGEIGTRVAAMAVGLGFQVVATRRRAELPGPPGVTVTTADQLAAELPQADVIVLTAPRTSETRAMIGADELARMKPTSVLVNVSRGRLVDEDALAEALEKKQIAGAGLDAFVREPLPDDHRLWSLPNVLISPHTAAFGRDYWAPAIDLFIENVGRFTRSAPLLNVVDKVRGY